MMSIVAEVLPLIEQLLAALPEAIDAGRQIWTLATAGTPPTADEQARYDAALDAAHKALQAS